MFIIALYSGIFIMAAAISYTINFCKQYLFFRFYTYLCNHLWAVFETKRRTRGELLSTMIVIWDIDKFE